MIYRRLRRFVEALSVARRSPQRATDFLAENLRGPRRSDPGPERAIAAAVQWICLAQDCSASRDGGVARHFDLRTGWDTSYPETTGYIVPTLLALSRRNGNEDLRRRARAMLDWLISIQMPSGAFRGGVMQQEPVRPVTFNTGQILLGLAAGSKEWPDRYLDPMRRAADWLVQTQDPDGAWRKHESPFVRPGEKAYCNHVSWALVEADRVCPGHGYADAAIRNVRWSITNQAPNGWVDRCCLTDFGRPLTHTLGYFLRGVLEAYGHSRDDTLLRAALLTGVGLLGAQRPDGSLPGRLTSSWKPAVRSSCLTGNVQIAHCWLLLHEHTGDTRFVTAARAANRFVRRTIDLDGHPDTRGGIAGSFPIWGDYERYEYLNWAAKFFIDAQTREQALDESVARSPQH